MTRPRGYVAGKFGVELDGIMAGWVNSAEGGTPSSDVVLEKVGPDHIVKKHIAGVKYDDITFVCGTGMSRAFYEWMKASFDHNYQRKDGAIIHADYDYHEIERLDFFKALITEIGFPACDAASKDAAKMTIKCAPEYTKLVSKAGSSIAGNKYSIGKGQQKKWSPANFRLRIDGLDCTRVAKIEALTVKQKVVDNPIGELRGFQREPAHLEVPNLVVTVPTSHTQGFNHWLQDFVVNGNNGDDKEKTGTLEFLTPDLKDALFTITFEHLGIFKLTNEKSEAASENIRRAKIEMYCENMKFQFHQSTWA
jgi:phage tail-like protein